MVRIALRGSSEGLPVEIGPARTVPLDAERWRQLLVEGTPLGQPVERFTTPDGWAMTVVETRTARGINIYAFYVVIGLVFPVRVRELTAAQAERTRALLPDVDVIWDNAVVALEDL